LSELATAQRILPRTSSTSSKARLRGIILITLTQPCSDQGTVMTKAQILIVEDDRSLAEVLEYNLRQDGYQTAVANDGQDGLRQARLKAPDLVLLDLMLPM